MDLDTWIEIGDRNAREIGEQEQIDFETYVAPAILEIDAAARRAERDLNIQDLDWTPKMMDEAENLLRTFVVYNREPKGEEPGVSGSSRHLGNVMTRPAPVSGHSDIDQASPLHGAATSPALPTETDTGLSAPQRRPNKSRR